MDQKKDHSVSSEVQERLQELFHEGNEVSDDHLFQDVQEPIDKDLRELKAVVLSIDWEITDEIMSILLKQIETLKKVYQHDRILILFLQLLGTVGKYIQVKKASAHPDSIKLLSSTFQSFEKAVINKQLSVNDRKKLLQIEVNRFNDLKNQIAYKDDIPGSDIRRDSLKQVHGKNIHENVNDPMPVEFASAIEEIKKMIQSEFKKLRSELNTWMQNRS